MTKIYFILIFLISFVTVYAQNESDSAQVTAQTEMPQSAAVQTFPTKTEADSAYIRNDFAASVEMYENILKNEGESSDIYYNLGNSYYKMNIDSNRIFFKALPLKYWYIFHKKTF